MLTAALLAHLLSLTILATGVLGGTMVHAVIESTLRTSPGRAAAYAPLIKRFGITSSIGGGLMLLSGVFVLYTRQWHDLQHVWLHYKLTLFAVLLLMGPLVARPAGMRLAAVLANGEDGAATAPLMRRMAQVHLLSVVGLMAIITLGVYGPRQ